jgi:hypothetical protein
MSSAGESSCAWFVAFAGFPGAQAGPPGGHRTPVGLVVRAEPADESRFLVPADECCGDQPEGCGVQQQSELAQEQLVTPHFKWFVCQGRRTPKRLGQGAQEGAPYAEARNLPSEGDRGATLEAERLARLAWGGRLAVEEVGQSDGLLD